TPNANLTVTHVRSYFGTRVSIWTDAGILLASQNVTSSAGAWVETPLSSPVQLLAGNRYRIGVYTAGSPYYGRFDQPSSFTDGTIDQAYFTSGDGFPAQTDSWRWIFVDIKYTATDTLLVPVAPANTTSFSNGVWTGNLTIQGQGTNVILTADDGKAHTG